MDTIGLDLYKRESQLCIIGSGGEITEKRIVTSRERFTAVLGGRARCRILLEPLGPQMVSIVVSIRTRKMFAEVRKMFVNARHAEQDVRERQASRNF
jgi:hypothetical protein